MRSSGSILLSKFLYSVLSGGQCWAEENKHNQNDQKYLEVSVKSYERTGRDRLKVITSFHLVCEQAGDPFHRMGQVVYEVVGFFFFKV